MPKRNLLYFLLLISLVLVQGRYRGKGFRRSQARRSRLRSNYFDIIIFTQSWPQTACFIWKEESDRNACILPQEDEWSIHGIWPTKYHTNGPNFCNSSLPFNETALEPLKTELQEKWMNIRKGKSFDSLWRHEWEKHGTCAVDLDSMNTELKYFQEGLNLFDVYDMKHVLGKANILPGQSYGVQEIFDAVEKILGKKGQVTCAKSSETDESYILEIRICLSKALELIDCDGITEFPTNCDKSRKVNYPGNVPLHFQAIQV